MKIDIIADVFFTNEVNETKSIKDKIISFSVYAEKGKLYKTLTLEAKELFVSPELVKDGVARVSVKVSMPNFYQNNAERITPFYVEDITYNSKKEITLICKTKGIVLDDIFNKQYLGTAKGVISSILDTLNITHDLSKLTDFNLLGGAYTAKDQSYYDIIKSITDITGAEFYEKDNIIYVQDCQKIDILAESEYDYDTLKSITSFSSTSNKDEEKIKGVYFNTKDVEEVFSIPLIVLDIDPSPQPLSPDEVKIYVGDDNVYKISPVKSRATIYSNPIGEVELSGADFSRIEDYGVIEKYQLDKESFLRISGGIKSVIGLQLDDVDFTNYTYQANNNVIIFNAPISGEIEISYYTDIYRAYLPSSSNKEKTINIVAKYQNQKIDYIHKYTAQGYYPLDYKYELNLVKDWNVEPNEAINASGNILRVDVDGVKTVIDTWNADAFGEIDITFENYGVYVFELTGYDDLYIKFYVNDFSVGITNVLPNE